LFRIIIEASHQPHHLIISYTVNGQETCVPLPSPLGSEWHLKIEGHHSDADLFNVFPIDRLSAPASTADAAKDFKWVLNLDDPRDFRNHPRPMKEQLFHNALRPIIRIRNGRLYNGELTDSLQQQLGHGSPTAFGVASNVLGVDLQVPIGQFITLRNASAGHDPNIIRHKVLEREQVKISITNVGSHQDERHRTHFKLYYGAFRVNDEDQYDFFTSEKDHSTSPSASDAESGQPAFDEGQRSVESLNKAPGPLCGTVNFGG